MAKLPNNAAIAKAIMDILKTDFTDVDIVTVRILDRVDDSDGTTLKIQVVFDGASKNLDARKVSGAVRHVRPKLFDMGEDAFPVFSFISKGDFEHLEPA
jgi:hypothetical protein